MRILFDTSVLVAAIVEVHPEHNKAFPWLKRAISGEIEIFVSCHTLAEVYAVLTRIPLKPKISPGLASRFIRENILSKAYLIELTGEEYIEVILEMGNLDLSGGVIYDALIAMAGRKAKVNKLLTFNSRDFLRVWPEGKDKIITP